MSKAAPPSERAVGLRADPLVLAIYDELVASGLVGLETMGGEGESMVVSGVTYEYEDEFLVAAAALVRTDDPFVVLEVSEPTVLGMSARSMSTSSEARWAGSEIGVPRYEGATV